MVKIRAAWEAIVQHQDSIKFSRKSAKSESVMQLEGNGFFSCSADLGWSRSSPRGKVVSSSCLVEYITILSSSYSVKKQEAKKERVRSRSSQELRRKHSKQRVRAVVELLFCRSFRSRFSRSLWLILCNSYCWITY